METSRYTPRPGTLHEVYQACLKIDWHGKDRSQLLNARRAMDYFGWDSSPSLIDDRALDQFLAWLRAEGPNGSGCSNATINRYLSSIQIMLKRARRMGLINELPMFPERRLLKEAEPRDLVVEPRWFAELLDVLEQKEHRQDVRLVQFLYHAGCRVSEALDLTWDRVSDRHVQFVKTKGSQPRRIPLPEPAREVLRQGRAASLDRPFPLGYRAFAGHYREAVSVVCERLQLSRQTEKEWNIHALRHTCLTNLAMKGWSAPAIMQWAGHKSLAVTQRYVHQAAVDLDQLVRANDIKQTSF